MKEIHSLSWGAQSDEGGRLGTGTRQFWDRQRHTHRCCSLTLPGATRESFLQEVVSEPRNKGLTAKGRQAVGLKYHRRVGTPGKRGHV